METVNMTQPFPNVEDFDSLEVSSGIEEDSQDLYNTSWLFYNASNSSEPPQIHPDSAKLKEIYAIMMPMIIALCVTSGVVSSCVVCATPWIKRPISPTIRLSLSLAAANTVFSATLAVAVVVNSYLPTVYGINASSCVSLSIEAVRMGSILVQILHLLVVAFNHYLGTLRPLHYAATMTPAVLKAILLPLWITPMVGMVVAFSSIPGQGFQSQHCGNNYFYLKGLTFRVVWACLFFGPTVLIALVYCHIFHLLKNRGLHLVSAEQRNQLKRNIKTVRTTALIVGSFVLGWGPAVVKFVLVCDECVIPPEEIGLIAGLASGAIVNSIYCLKVFTDTVIYALQLREIRRALLCMWRLVTGREMEHHNRGLSTRTSRFSRAASTKNSFSSPTLHRLNTPRTHYSQIMVSSRSKLGSDSSDYANASNRSDSCHLSQGDPCWGRVTLEIPTMSNNHNNDDPRMKSLIEETSLELIQETNLDFINENDRDHL